jgi:hypothetical protein
MDAIAASNKCQEGFLIRVAASGSASARCSRFSLEGDRRIKVANPDFKRESISLGFHAPVV